MTSTGRTFAANPRSASQTSPRSGFIISPFCPIKHLEHFRSRRSLVRLSPNAVSIIENDAGVASAIKLPHALLHLAQLVVTQFWQRGLNLRNGTHTNNIHQGCWVAHVQSTVKPGGSDGDFCASPAGPSVTPCARSPERKSA